MAAEFVLKPAGFADLPHWADDDHAAAFAAFRRSCRYVLDSTVRGSKARSAGAGLKAACAKALSLGVPDTREARAFFESHFTPHRVVHAERDGLLTGYYEPRLAGSRLPTPQFTVPVLRRPPDLVNIVEESERGATGQGLTHGRRTAAGIEPYPDRAAIEAGALAGQGLEFLYFADPVDVFVMQVQGSGLVVLPDGSEIRIGYDGKNGHPYTSVGRHLIETGAVAADALTLEAMVRWLRSDPERGRRAMQVNRSYVFFRELAGEQALAPLGAGAIPLTPGRSLAVDASCHPIGTPIHVCAPALRHAGDDGGLHRLMIAQDVGSAITGPERGDIFFGSGPNAGERAGITKHRGSFHVLLADEGAGA